MHCHLRPPIPPVVLGVNYDLRGRLHGPYCTSMSNVNTISRRVAQLLVIQQIVSPVLGGPNEPLILRVG